MSSSWHQQLLLRWMSFRELLWATLVFCARSKTKWALCERVCWLDSLYGSYIAPSLQNLQCIAPPLRMMDNLLTCRMVVHLSCSTSMHPNSVRSAGLVRYPVYSTTVEILYPRVPLGTVLLSCHRLGLYFSFSCVSLAASNPFLPLSRTAVLLLVRASPSYPCAIPTESQQTSVGRCLCI